MQIFKFADVGGGAVLLRYGDVINDIDDVMWIERYGPPGEFTIKSPLSSGLRDELPIGSLISHMDSADVMMVENHEIIDEEDEDTQLVITGRSLDGFLDERVVGWTLYWDWLDVPGLSQQPVYQLSAGFSYVQLVAFLGDHITTARGGVASNNLGNVVVSHKITLPSANYPSYAARNMRRGYVSDGAKSILEQDQLGLRIVRPGIALPGLSAHATDTRFLVHDGIDKTATVIFSYELGDLAGANYLFSNKRNKTEGIVSGRYLDQAITSAFTGLQHREIFVDGSDIDGVYTAYPTGSNKTNALALMTMRGNEAVSANNLVEMTSINVSKTNRNRYRVDYDIGDLVRVDGNYGAVTSVRVVEHVEIENKDGASSYPTLQVVPVTAA